MIHRTMRFHLLAGRPEHPGLLPSLALLIWLGAGALPVGAQTQTAQPAASPKAPAKILPCPGEVFLLNGSPAFLIRATNAPAGTRGPWVWYAPTLPGLPAKEEQWMFEKFLAAGIAIAGVDVGESSGSPAGRARFTEFYAELTERRGLSPTPCLLARSRGGLMLYNWAVEHPQCVAGVAGIYPVCDLTSYPGLTNACGAYGLTAKQLAAALPQQNPINRLEPLARAQVPLYHIHGDSDTVVPLEKNSGELARRYRELGGPVTLNIVPGQGHNMWTGWFQCQELVDFVIARARADSPAGK